MNETSGKPLYRLVIDTIVARIASGDLPPGAMLPSEHQLGAELGVSQGTARKALIELEQRGILQRAQGRGTFVTVQTPDSALFNFFRLRKLDGAQDAPNLIHQNLTRRSAQRAEKELLFGEPDEVFEIHRLRGLSDGDKVLETAIVPTGLFPGLMDRAPLPNTLYVFYQQAFSCIVVRAEETLRAVRADADAAQHLDIDLGTPLLSVDRLAYDILGRCVERRISMATNDAHSYAVKLS